jgi:hypothetical protein
MMLDKQANQENKPEVKQTRNLPFLLWFCWPIKYFVPLYILKQNYTTHGKHKTKHICTVDNGARCTKHQIISDLCGLTAIDHVTLKGGEDEVISRWEGQTYTYLWFLWLGSQWNYEFQRPPKNI